MSGLASRAVLALVLILLACRTPAEAVAAPAADPVAAAYLRLDRIRDTRRDQLTTYLERIGDLAAGAARDSAVQNYFDVKQRFWQLREVAAPPPELVSEIERMKESFGHYYLKNYMAFSDLLCIDSGGFVLSSVRRKGEYHQNLFEGDLARTGLSRQLRSAPGESFVDYEFYWVADEPSAFFVEPMIIRGEVRGWLVLQCALNRINAIFARDDGLGRTGETFLVNRDHRMLTESHLRPDSGALVRSLASENIDPKFAAGEGHRRVIDYRGYPALTSFTVCNVAGTEWLVVAKIDEDEVLTEHYREQSAELEPQLAAALAAATPGPCGAHTLPLEPTLVDMDEYRISQDRPLVTFGVATCTAVVVTLPGGTSYLGHASEGDAIYGGTATDLLDNMLHRINRFEIAPYQLRDVQVTLVAPHLNSLHGAIQRLVTAGLQLSQIRVLHAPAAASATVVHYPANDRTVVRWFDADNRPLLWQCADESPDLGAVLRGILSLP